MKFSVTTMFLHSMGDDAKSSDVSVMSDGSLLSFVRGGLNLTVRGAVLKP